MCIAWLTGSCVTSPERGAAAGASSAAADSSPPFAGTYCASDGDLIVIAPSSSGLTYYRPASGVVRVLFADSDGVWRAGPGLLVRDSTEFVVQFNPRGPAGGPGDRLVITKLGHPAVTAGRVQMYEMRSVALSAGDVHLAGTLFSPSSSGPRPAVVLVHGSGAQDRWGPFGYSYLVADYFARAGFAVLAYDKRGVGGSTGDWRAAGFDELASDASVAMRWLSRQPAVDQHAVGLWGISQAGWVAARSTRLLPPPAFVVLVSAAGAGITVAEQNLYNVVAELRARGWPQPTIERARVAWQRLYALVEHRDVTDPNLDSVVRTLRDQAVPMDLLPPMSAEVDWETGDAWYQTLSLRFDPMPAWRAYDGGLLAIFGSRDAATPTIRITRRLRPIVQSSDGRVVVRVFAGADHFMLASPTGSIRSLPRLERFVPGVFTVMTQWAREAVNLPGTGHLSTCRRREPASRDGTPG